MRVPRLLPPLLTAVLLLLAGAAPAAADDGDFTLQDPRITESSGLAASRQHEGVYWTHNDSEDGPYIYAVDSATGETVATVTLRGVGEPRDVEAISMGPGNEIYVGDIGDNLDGGWQYVWIYRLPEPKQLEDQTVDAVQYEVQYEDGARDAEALMVHPKTGKVYIASKKKDGGGALYEAPAELSTSSMNTFRRVAPIDLWVTDGAFSPDGEWLAMRSYLGGRMYRWADGGPKEDGRLDVPIQQQGESVTYSADGSALMFGSEGEQSEVVSEGVEGGGDGGSGAEDQDDGAGGQGRPEEDRNNRIVGVLTFAGAAALIILFRRALRLRRRD